MSAPRPRIMAEYNRWMNERLYDCCERLSDEQRKLTRRTTAVS